MAFPKSAARDGTAVRYERRNAANPNAVEMHTTLSAYPFHLELPPGRYTVSVEHGKEYFPESKEVIIGREPQKLTFNLRRWINMAEQGWFSGDTHVHRAPHEMANVALAEDLNVTLPLTGWTTVSTVPPSSSDRGFQGEFSDTPVRLDATHLLYPRNTE